MFVLALYEIGLGYGGPEEGGWWYDTGNLRRTVRTFSDREAAYAACRRCNAWLDILQKDCRAVSSVLYSGGRYRAQVHARNAPPYYPETKPYYE